MKTFRQANQLPAVDRMDVPRRRVEQRQVGDVDGVRVHQLDQVPARVLELVLVEFRPPHRALSINCAVVTWTMKNHIVRHHSRHSQIRNVVHQYIDCVLK